jgi:S-(hydroxymethyl)glutathione dehydrogenase/alcohol dehydrogenase
MMTAKLGCVKARRSRLVAARQVHSPEARGSTARTSVLSTTAMRTQAAVFHAIGEPLTIEEIELAELGPHDVVVRMEAVGICGTDLHQVKGEWTRPTPMVLGHEGAGVVETVGTEVQKVAPGDEVVLSWASSCGSCADCARGRPAACLQLHRAIANGTRVDGTTGLSLRGKTVYRGTATGCLAERVVVSEHAALRTRGSVALSEAALLGCAALTGVGAALFAARVQPDASVLVVGAGGVGQFVVQGARIAGARTIVSVDPIQGRREQAGRVGATHTTTPDALSDLLAELAPGGVEYAFDAVGDPATSALALHATRSGGTAMIVGLPATGLRLDLDPAEFIRREKWLTGTMYGSEDPAIALPILLEYVAEGLLDLASLVGPTYPLDAVNEAIRGSIAGSPGRVLVAPQMPGSA